MKKLFLKTRINDIVTDSWTKFANAIDDCGGCDVLINACIPSRNGTKKFDFQGNIFEVDKDTFIRATFNPPTSYGAVTCTVEAYYQPEYIWNIFQQGGASDMCGVLAFTGEKAEVINFPFIKDKRILKVNYVQQLIFDDELKTYFRHRDFRICVIKDEADRKKAVEYLANTKYELRSGKTLDEKALELLNKYIVKEDDIYYGPDSRTDIKAIFNRASAHFMPHIFDKCRCTFQVTLHNPKYRWNDLAKHLRIGALYNLYNYIESCNEKTLQFLYQYDEIQHTSNKWKYTEEKVNTNLENYKRSDYPLYLIAKTPKYYPSPVFDKFLNIGVKIGVFTPEEASYIDSIVKDGFIDTMNVYKRLGIFNAPNFVLLYNLDKGEDKTVWAHAKKQINTPENIEKYVESELPQWVMNRSEINKLLCYQISKFNEVLAKHRPLIYYSYSEDDIAGCEVYEDHIETYKYFYPITILKNIVLMPRTYEKPAVDNAVKRCSADHPEVINALSGAHHNHNCGSEVEIISEQSMDIFEWFGIQSYVDDPNGSSNTPVSDYDEEVKRIAKNITEDHAGEDESIPAVAIRKIIDEQVENIKAEIISEQSKEVEEAEKVEETISESSGFEKSGFRIATLTDGIIDISDMEINKPYQIKSTNLHIVGTQRLEIEEDITHEMDKKWREEHIRPSLAGIYDNTIKTSFKSTIEFEDGTSITIPSDLKLIVAVGITDPITFEPFNKFILVKAEELMKNVPLIKGERVINDVNGSRYCRPLVLNTGKTIIPKSVTTTSDYEVNGKFNIPHITVACDSCFSLENGLFAMWE